MQKLAAACGVEHFTPRDSSALPAGTLSRQEDNGVELSGDRRYVSSPACPTQLPWVPMHAQEEDVEPETPRNFSGMSQDPATSNSSRHSIGGDWDGGIHRGARRLRPLSLDATLSAILASNLFSDHGPHMYPSRLHVFLLE